MADEKVESEKKHKKNIFNNYWAVSTIILVILLIAVLLINPMSQNVSKDEAGESVVNFLNAQTGGGVGLVNVEAQGSLYQVTVSYQNQDIPVYITSDGKNFVYNIVPLTGDAINTNTNEEKIEVPKSDKPTVELFVMTYCPYGTQAEKAMIPAIRELGTNVDAKIRFVHYFMHGDEEEEETYRQICIREEQPAKFLNYLECFLEDGNATRCMTKYLINVDVCMKTKAKDYYEKDSELSQNYGVQGSPTLVINGVQASFNRSPSGALSTVCSAFNKAPNECDAELSTTSTSSGFGASGNSGSSGSCA
ncbi:MAG: DsbA family protein [Nanoarchaeota archaeon]